jgi:hypothetical protein
MPAEEAEPPPHKTSKPSSRRRSVQQDPVADEKKHAWGLPGTESNFICVQCRRLKVRAS